MIWNQTAFFGAGAVGEIPRQLVERHFTKALVVSDQGLVEAGVTAKVTELLDGAGFPFELFTDVAPNPPIENVKAGLTAFEAAQADVLIAVGGGSPLDTCKGIGIIANNPEYADVLSLEGTPGTKHPSVPIIAVPTTAGTASETTINYVLTDKSKQRKFVCVDPHDIPVLAIVDAEMMADAPRSLRVATGLDALTHAIEGYITKGAWELSDMFHLKAIQLIAQALPLAVDGDAKASDDMALAQYVAGMGYSNVGLGIVHSMAHALGGYYDAPHGVANGLLLAPVMAFNAPASGDKYRDIGAAFGVAGALTRPLAEVGADTVKAVADMIAALGNPTMLRQIGAQEADIPALALMALGDVCTPGNPRPVTAGDIESIYRSVL